MKTIFISLITLVLQSSFAYSSPNDLQVKSSEQAETLVFDPYAFYQMIDQLSQTPLLKRHYEIARLILNPEHNELTAKNFKPSLLKFSAPGSFLSMNGSGKKLTYFLRLVAESGTVGSLDLLKRIFETYDKPAEENLFSLLDKIARGKKRQTEEGFEKLFRLRMVAVARRAIRVGKKSNLREEAERLENYIGREYKNCIVMLQDWLAR